MRKVTLFLLAIFTLFSSISCKKSSAPIPNDYFIVWSCGGVFWGPNPHATFISITDTGLYCDTTHPECYYPKSVSELNFNIPMPDSQYTKVKDLPTSIPADLLLKSGSYGTVPFDGSTKYVWARIKGVRYYWDFGSNVDSCRP